MAIHALTTPMPAAHPGSLRARMESAIESMMAACERLVAELDAMDGDPDLEDGADAEPSLGSLNPTTWADQSNWSAGGTDELEDACEDEGGEHDGREPEGYT